MVVALCGGGVRLLCVLNDGCGLADCGYCLVDC